VISVDISDRLLVCILCILEYVEVCILEYVEENKHPLDTIDFTS
jgi:hypothetical protein